MLGSSETVPAKKSHSPIAKFVMRNPAFFAIFAFLCALILCEKAFPQIDEMTDRYFDDAITEAGMTFATVRLINGGISVIKESSVTVTPFGVGTNIAAGQVLDPLDDVIERLSDILFTTIVSLSIQKIVYEIVGEFAIYFVAILLAGTLVTTFFLRSKKLRSFNLFLKKTALLLLLVRIALPCTALVSEGLEKYFFTPRISECQAQMQIFESATKLEFSDDDGWMDKSSKLTDYIKDKFITYKNNLGEIVETSLKISGLYVALFFVQVIILPLASFFILIKVTNLLFSKNYNYVISNPLRREHIDEETPN